MGKDQMLQELNDLWENATPEFRLIMLREQDRVFNRREIKRQRTNAFLSAVKKGHIDPVKTILKDGMDVNEQDADLGNTALIHAVDSGNIEMVKLLIEGGADPEIRNNRGYNAFSAAKLIGKNEIIELLKSSKSNSE